MMQDGKIVSFAAWISTDAVGDEGLMAFRHPISGWMPLVAADAARERDIDAMAAQLMQAGARGKKVYFVRQESN